MEETKFKTPKEMVNWLIDNHGLELLDNYGRRWKFERFSFYFKDIGSNEYKEGLFCLHLYNTVVWKK